MNHDEFSAQFMRLLRAFNPARGEEKSKIYFEELTHFSASAFEQACQEIIRTSDRFPSIAQLIATCQSKTKSPGRATKADCLVCDGFGWVLKYGTAYRGNCAHGRTLSAKIATWPMGEYAQKQALKKAAGEELYVYGKWPDWAAGIKIFPGEGD